MPGFCFGQKTNTDTVQLQIDMGPKKDTANGGSGKMTKEEEKLLLESSRQVTGTASALFYGNAFIVSALPICELADKPAGYGHVTV